MSDKLSKCKSFSNVKVICEDMFPNFPTYTLGLSSQTLDRRDVNKTALQLLPPSKPHGYLPVLTVGDGNCLTRSLSRIVFGNEKYHIGMRHGIITGLCINRSLYLDEDYASPGTTFQKGKNLQWISLICLIATMGKKLLIRPLFSPFLIKKFSKQGSWACILAFGSLRLLLMFLSARLYPCILIRVQRSFKLFSANLCYQTHTFFMRHPRNQNT